MIAYNICEIRVNSINLFYEYSKFSISLKSFHLKNTQISNKITHQKTFLVSLYNKMMYLDYYFPKNKED